MTEEAKTGSTEGTKWDLTVAAKDLVPTYINHFAAYTMAGSMRINMGESLYPGITTGAARISVIVNTERALELAKIILLTYSTTNPTNSAVSEALKLLGPLSAK